MRKGAGIREFRGFRVVAMKAIQPPVRTESTPLIEAMAAARVWEGFRS